ncbi:MAG: hypothetical protein JW741_19520 [Sedimentisphaerales bacterium]|nr:hypothetical protein [Sedimentisphaerales bacterium]
MRGRSVMYASVLGCGITLAAVCGCGGGGYGEKISLPPSEKRVPIESRFAEGKPLYFPKDQPLNVFDAQRTSSGEATAESWAKPAGTAMAKAAATAVGTAKAEFQIGQVIETRADKAIDVTAVFDLKYEYTVETDPSDLTKPADTLGLKVYISDSNRNVLKRAVLVDLGTAEGPRHFAGREKPSFDLTLEPGLAYQFVVAGLVEVQGTETSAASGQIDLQTFELELLPRNTHR